MHKFIAITTAALMISAALPAYASSDAAACRSLTGGQALSLQDITAKVAAMGYTVRKVEHDDGCYEVDAIDKNGARVELKLHPVTGELVKSKHKS